MAELNNLCHRLRPGKVSVLLSIMSRNRICIPQFVCGPSCRIFTTRMYLMELTWLLAAATLVRSEVHFIRFPKKSKSKQVGNKRGSRSCTPLEEGTSENKGAERRMHRVPHNEGNKIAATLPTHFPGICCRGDLQFQSIRSPLPTGQEHSPSDKGFWWLWFSNGGGEGHCLVPWSFLCYTPEVFYSKVLLRQSMVFVIVVVVLCMCVCVSVALCVFITGNFFFFHNFLVFKILSRSQCLSLPAAWSYYIWLCTAMLRAMVTIG